MIISSMRIRTMSGAALTTRHLYARRPTVQVIEEVASDLDEIFCAAGRHAAYPVRHFVVAPHTRPLADGLLARHLHVLLSSGGAVK